MKPAILIFLLLSGTFFLTGSPDSPYENYILVRYYMNQNMFDQADDIITHHLKIFPDDPFILTEKAVIAKYRNRNQSEIHELLEKAIRILPDYYYSNFLLGSSYFSNYAQSGDVSSMEKAIPYLQRAVKSNENFHDGLFLLGIIYHKKGNFEVSNQYFSRALRLKNSAEANYYQANNHIGLGEKDKAIASCLKILSLDPNNKTALGMLSQIYIEKYDFKSAEKYLKKQFDQDPSDPEVAYYYLQALFLNGDVEGFKMALNTSNMSILKYPFLVYAHVSVLNREKKYREAEKFLSQIDKKKMKAVYLADIYSQRYDYFNAYLALMSSKERKTHFYYSMLLEILFRLNLNNKIVDVFHTLKGNHAILSSFTPNDCFNVAYAFIKLNRIHDLNVALKTISGVSNRPNDNGQLLGIINDYLKNGKVNRFLVKPGRTLLLVLHLLKTRGELDEGVALLNDLIRERETEFLYRELCEFYFLQKDYSNVERLFRKIFKKFDQSVWVKNFYAYYLAGQNKKLKSALELSRDTLDNDGENPAYLDTYGYILFRIGRIDESFQYLKKAYDKYPLEPEIMDHLIQYYRKKGLKQPIIEMYQRAIDQTVDFKDECVKELHDLQKMDL